MVENRNVYLKFVFCIIWAIVTNYSLWCLQRYNIYTENFTYDTHNILVYLTPLLVTIFEILFFKRIIKKNMMIISKKYDDNFKKSINLIIMNNVIFGVFTFVFFYFEKKYIFYEYEPYRFQESFSFIKILLFSTIGILLNLIPSSIMIYKIFNKNGIQKNKKNSLVGSLMLYSMLIFSVTVIAYVQIDIPELRFVYGEIGHNFYGIKSAVVDYSDKGNLVDYRDQSLKEEIIIPRRIANRDVCSIDILPQQGKTYFIPDSLNVSSLKYGWFQEGWEPNTLLSYVYDFKDIPKVIKYGNKDNFYIEDNIIFDKETKVMDCSLYAKGVLKIPKTIEVIASDISRIDTISSFEVEKGNQYFYSYEGCLFCYDYNDLVLEDYDRIIGLSWNLKNNTKLFRNAKTEKELKEITDKLLVCYVPYGKEVVNLPDISNKIVYVHSERYNKVKVNISNKSKNIEIYGNIDLNEKNV